VTRSEGASVHATTSIYRSNPTHQWRALQRPESGPPLAPAGGGGPDRQLPERGQPRSLERRLGDGGGPDTHPGHTSSTTITAAIPPRCATFTTWRCEARARIAIPSSLEANPIT